MGAPQEEDLKKHVKILKNVPPPTYLGSFLEPGDDFLGTYFLMFLGYLPRTTLAQKATNMQAFGSQFGDFFRKRENLDLRDPSPGLGLSLIHI